MNQIQSNGKFSREISPAVSAVRIAVCLVKSVKPRGEKRLFFQISLNRFLCKGAYQEIQLHWFLNGSYFLKEKKNTACSH